MLSPFDSHFRHFCSLFPRNSASIFTRLAEIVAFPSVNVNSSILPMLSLFKYSVGLGAGCNPSKDGVKPLYGVSYDPSTSRECS